MKDFKIRCSSISKIMTNAKAKGDISVGAQTYCKTWLKEQLYNRKVEFTSKYTAKGKIMEDQSLDRIAKHLDLHMLIKNEEELENDFMTGTPDADPKPFVIDAKNSWQFATFPLFETVLPSKDYWWQMQGYMDLTGKDLAKVVFTLEDTPYHLIESEARRWCWNEGHEFNEDLVEEFAEKMTYQDLEKKPHLLIKSFDVARDDDAIASIKTRVMECRTFIHNLNKNLKK